MACPRACVMRHGDKGKLKSRTPEANNFYISQSGEASSYLHGAGDAEERGRPLSLAKAYIMGSLRRGCPQLASGRFLTEECFMHSQLMWILRGSSVDDAKAASWGVPKAWHPCGKSDCLPSGLEGIHPLTVCLKPGKSEDHCSPIKLPSLSKSCGPGRFYQSSRSKDDKESESHFIRSVVS